MDSDLICALIQQHLTADESFSVQAIGDSTCEGGGDDDRHTLHGWVGRTFLGLAHDHDYNLRIQAANTSVGYTVFSWLYGDWVSLYTASDPSRPTLSIYCGGWPGGRMGNYLTYATAMLPDPNVAIVIIDDGFNELSASTFASQCVSYAGAVQTHCPGAPIVYITQNATTRSATTPGTTPAWSSIIGAMITALIPGQSRPLTPPLQASTTVSGVWILDTKQAGQTAADLSDGLHPNTVGYQMQADFIVANLFPSLATPTITTAPGDLSPMIRTEPFSQTITVLSMSPVSWSITAGKLPTGLSLDPSTGAISGTPVDFGGTSFTFVVRATNSIGYGEQTYTGVIGSPIITHLPFIPSTEARYRNKIGGYYYPVTPKIFSDGSFVTLSTKS